MPYPMPDPTPTPTYPRLPELDPRQAGEDPQGYGLRALLFVLATDCPYGVDTEGLELAAYAYKVAVSARDLSPVAAERLAEARRAITRTLDYRKADEARRLAELAEPAPAGVDKPNLGPGAPLRPAPVVPPAPSSALPAPAAPVPVPVTGPAAIPARYTAISPALAARPSAPAAPVTNHGHDLPAPAPRPTFQAPVRQVARPSAPAAPQVPADQWGF